jgi:UDP:flavonoid glycosyltransferase YjiC (YdhE family)
LGAGRLALLVRRTDLSKVFYAWELGANLGHMGAFLPLAKALRARGHEVHWAVARTKEAARLLHKEGIHWVQAPTVRDQQPGHAPENYSAILLHFGYADPEQLLGMVVAWRELLRLTKAEIVLADHAPTAILAARTLGLPVMLHGGGFTAPPKNTSPTPPLRPWQSLDKQLLLDNDAAVLQTMNGILAAYGRIPLATVSALFDVDESAILTFPELDPYPNRPDGRYWGMASTSHGASPVWPQAEGPKVFAYVRPEGAHWAWVLECLASVKGSVLVYAPGLPEEQRAKYANNRLYFSDSAVDIRQTANEADLGVMWGGGGVTAITFLQAGTPLLLLPEQIEPFLQGLRIQALGAGLVCDLSASRAELPALLTRVLMEASFRTNAVAFAKAYQGVTQEGIVERMANRIEAICKG